MSSSIASSRAIGPFDSSLSHHEPLIRNKGRKRRRSRSLDYTSGDEYDQTRLIPLKSATVKTLERQVLCLQLLLQDASAQQPSISTGHTCPPASCRKHFKNLEHLYRHVRSQNDPIHNSLAGFIDEKHCVICSRTFQALRGLVRHEKSHHGEIFTSRLDKFLQPPPSAFVAVDDAPKSSKTHKEGSCKTSNQKSSSHQNPRPVSSQANTSDGAEGTQAIQRPKILTTANEATVSASSNGRVELRTPSQFMGPGIIETDRWAAKNPLPTFGTDSLLAPPSWDNFYVDEHGLTQYIGKEGWDGFYGEQALP